MSDPVEVAQTTKVIIRHELVFEQELTLAMYGPNATVEDVVEIETAKSGGEIVLEDVYEDIEHLTVKKSTLVVKDKAGNTLFEDTREPEEDDNL